MKNWDLNIILPPKYSERFCTKFESPFTKVRSISFGRLFNNMSLKHPPTRNKLAELRSVNSPHLISKSNI